MALNPDDHPIAKAAALPGGVLGQAAGGFAGGVYHGAKIGWQVGAQVNHTGAVGRFVNGAVQASGARQLGQIRDEQQRLRDMQGNASALPAGPAAPASPAGPSVTSAAPERVSSGRSNYSKAVALRPTGQTPVLVDRGRSSARRPLLDTTAKTANTTMPSRSMPGPSMSKAAVGPSSTRSISAGSSRPSMGAGATRPALTAGASRPSAPPASGNPPPKRGGLNFGPTSAGLRDNRSGSRVSFRSSASTPLPLSAATLGTKRTNSLSG